MPAPSYALTNYFGTSDPAGDLVNLIEPRLTAAGWTYVTQVSFTQAATARYMRVWKNPASLNAAGVDFYIGLCKNQVAGIYFSIRAFEGFNSGTNTMTKPCVSGSATFSSFPTVMAYGGGIYVAMQANLIYSSTDGFTWTSVANPSPGQTWTNVRYLNGAFWAVAPSYTTGLTSTDGVTWTAFTLPSASNWEDISWASGKVYVVVGQGTTFATSPDGVTWTARTVTSGNWGYVVYHTGTSKYLTIAPSSSTTMWSTDGITWTAVTGALPATSNWTSLATNGTSIVAGATTSLSTVAYATDPTAATWATQTMPSTVQWGNVVWTGTQYVAVANTSTASATSPTGTTWTAAGALPASVAWSQVIQGNSTLVAMVNGTLNVAQSTNGGTSWTSTNFMVPRPYAPGNFPAANSLMPAITDSWLTLAVTTNYDIGILASKSYLVIGINTNATGTAVYSCYVGLFSPAYSDSQSTTPPLVVCQPTNVYNSGVQGTSRTLRTTIDTNAYGATASAESTLVGLWNSTTKENTSQMIRASRVMLIGGTPASGFTATAGFRGWLYDCIAVAVTNATVKVGDTATVGSTPYTFLTQGFAGITLAAAAQHGLFWNVLAGS